MVWRWLPKRILNRSHWNSNHYRRRSTRRIYPWRFWHPVGHRIIGPTITGGYASGEFQLSLTASTGAANIEISQLQLDRALFAAPDLIGSDQLMTQRTEASGNLNLSMSQVAADGFRFSSDLGKVNVDGVLNVSQLSSMLQNGDLMRQPFQMDGRIDIAKIASMLPTTLQLHDDLSIESGELSFQASTRVDKEVPKLIFNMDTANVRATRAGQPIVWQKPLRLVGTILVADGVVAMQNVRCDSDFFTVQGNGTIAEGTFERRRRLGAFDGSGEPVRRSWQYPFSRQTVGTNWLEGRGKSIRAAPNELGRPADRYQWSLVDPATSRATAGHAHLESQRAGRHVRGQWPNDIRWCHSHRFREWQGRYRLRTLTLVSTDR